MAEITLKGNKIHTSGNLPNQGESAKDFKLKSIDLQNKSLKDYEGKRLILNIFPSIDTATCSASVREFNVKASDVENTVVLCISKDLPFAQKRFCAAEGIENVEMLSDYVDGSFGKDYGLTITDGPLEGLLSRSVIVLNEKKEVIYTEQVSEIADEPKYDEALKSLT